MPRLRRRLTWLSTGALLVALLAASLALRAVVHDALQREFDSSVRASAQLITRFFRAEIAEYQTIEATLTHIAGELVFEDRVMRVRRPSGALFGATAMPAALPALPEPIRRVTVPLEPGLAPGWTIEVDASGARVAATEARIDRGLLLGIPLLVLLAGGFGWWLTGRALHPVGRMADAATQIIPGQGDRLPLTDPSDELGRLGGRFNALLDRLDGALTQQRRFLADAAHELRTPLARVLGRVEVARQAPPSPEAAATVLPAVHDELLRMSRLVDELLQLARADAASDATVGEMAVTRRPGYLDDVVADELPRWQVEAARLGITLTASELQEAPVFGDDLQLRRLLGILIDNALRYSEPSGTVQVRVGQDGETVHLIVADDGIGIPDDERGRLTERFFRGERARGHRPDGSGLGLAIAAWIVARHEGTLRFSSGTASRGTCVQVTMPAHRPLQTMRDGGPAASAPVP